MTVPATDAPRMPVPAPWRLVAALTTAGLIAGVVLAGVHTAAAPRIAANQSRALQNAVLAAVPGATRFERLAPVDGSSGAADAVYRALDANGQLVGYAVAGEGPGFMDTIRLLYGFDPRTDRVVGLRILDSRETPGLGDKIMTDPAFVSSFEALRVTPDIVAVTRGPRGADNEVDCIAGATISSKAVTDIVRSSIARWRPRLSAAAGGEHDE